MDRLISCPFRTQNKRIHQLPKALPWARLSLASANKIEMYKEKI